MINLARTLELVEEGGLTHQDLIQVLEIFAEELGARESPVRGIQRAIDDYLDLIELFIEGRLEMDLFIARVRECEANLISAQTLAGLRVLGSEPTGRFEFDRLLLALEQARAGELSPFELEPQLRAFQGASDGRIWQILLQDTEDLGESLQQQLELSLEQYDLISHHTEDFLAGGRQEQLEKSVQALRGCVNLMEHAMELLAAQAREAKRVRCLHCWKSNDAGRTNCGHCFKPLPALPRTTATPLERIGPGTVPARVETLLHEIDAVRADPGRTSRFTEIVEQYLADVRAQPTVENPVVERALVLLERGLEKLLEFEESEQLSALKEGTELLVEASLDLNRSSDSISD